jgi:hypothetical protein
MVPSIKEAKEKLRFGQMQEKIGLSQKKYIGASVDSLKKNDPTWKQYFGEGKSKYNQSASYKQTADGKVADPMTGGLSADDRIKKGRAIQEEAKKVLLKFKNKK